MSNSEMYSSNNVVDLRPTFASSPSPADVIRVNLMALRESVTAAWLERGVMLTREEQRDLQREISELCKHLSDLTQGD